MRKVVHTYDPAALRTAQLSQSVNEPAHHYASNLANHREIRRFRRVARTCFSP